MAATSIALGTLRPSYLLLLLAAIGSVVTPLLSQATDTVSRSQPLSGDGKLVSRGGKFAVGFFQPVGGRPDKWYLAVWFNKVSKLTPVWVANRVAPISDPKSSELKILEDGNMALYNQLNSPIWFTNITSNTSSPTVAVILDTGNFVLTLAYNLTNFLWQSFDEPTNVWLPGAKLGWNKITGLNRRLFSWKTSSDPSPGYYSVEIDLAGSNQFFYRWNSSEKSENYWATGSWTGTMFSGVPEMALYAKSLLTYDYVNNEQENYFMYRTNESKITAMFSMEIAGQVKAVSWMESAQDWVPFLAMPKAQCSVYLVCGPFSICTENAFTFCSCIRGFSKQYGGDRLYGNPIEGCTRNVGLPCGGNSFRKEKVDGFYALAVANFPNNAWSVAATSDNEYSSIGQSIYIRLAASEFSSPTKSKKNVTGVAIAGALCLILRNCRFSSANEVDGSLILYKYRDLQNLTNNFSEKLGKGSFGSVYKGVLADGTLVAVKKLDSISQGDKEFRAEVSTTGTVQHVNLIRLLGFCSERSLKILVYEYMPNGSLDRYMFGSNPGALSWSTRYQIALGIAKGLTYLHEKCRSCIIHCDIKPENVLLDASFLPKISDFGLAKLVGRDFSRVLTTMRGTIGYLAPEWISGTAITVKADVFSYGMMLFEIISGKRNLEEIDQSTETFFPVLIAKRLPKGNVQELLHDELTVDANFNEVETACKVACWCVQDDENSRPTMGQVVQVLEGLVDINMPPVPRCLEIIAERSLFSSREDRPLFGGQRLVSSGGSFALGFFNPANRASPISDPKSSQLTVSEDGNLVLLDQVRSLIWATNITTISINSTVGVILDSGNFVLAPASNRSNFQWQSFDDPTNVWLPGAKLGRNKITGQTTRFVSWKSSVDPSPGYYTLEIDPNGGDQFIHRWNDSAIYWETGQVKGVVWMENREDWVPFLALPKAQCTVYFVCGSFSMCSENDVTFCRCLRGFNKQYNGEWRYGDPSGGCMRNTKLQCGGNSSRKTATDGFYALAVSKLPDKALSLATVSTDGCKEACLNNCSCTAYSYVGGCSLWYGDLINLVAPTDGSMGQSMYIRLAASEFSSSTKTRKAVVIAVSIAGAILATLIVIIGILLIRRKRSFNELNKVEGSLVVFRYRFLQHVTKKFSERLGKGSFGSVYKGTLPDGTLIAVKKLDSFSQGDKQFRAEVSTIGTIQHVNLIRLLGFCSERSRKMLVYEFMPNKSLDRYLFGSTSMALSWETRYQIALGIAKGLAYLHEGCRSLIIHCDIKPENVLLDADCMPKIADFGLAKLLGRDFSRVLTSMRGTIGYLAPEWISGAAITAKADVFSYGMVLFEIISGKRNTDWHQQGEETFFPVLVAMRLPEGKVHSLLGPVLIADANIEEVERACKVACWCVQDDESTRPTMGDIVQILEGLVDVNFPPVPWYLHVLAQRSNFSTEAS
uniref:non-specific serine/threonine protein kinase n=1 Tax=Leersia perrieri TaxID=77586 RepID=A0A0D9V3F7_9ORYZ